MKTSNFDLSSALKDGVISFNINDLHPDDVLALARMTGHHDQFLDAIIASNSPSLAASYAVNVLNAPHPILEKIACKDAYSAYSYASGIGGPSDATRLSASKSPSSALSYAKYVDKEPHTVTAQGVLQTETYREDYRTWVSESTQQKKAMLDSITQYREVNELLNAR